MDTEIPQTINKKQNFDRKKWISDKKWFSCTQSLHKSNALSKTYKCCLTLLVLVI